MKSIEVKHITKIYQSAIQAKKGMSFRELVFQQLLSFFSSSSSVIPFKALDDISFEVEEGEVFGLIGKNGSGKSTLLKILSRITSPTMGNALIRGHVASLLEVGTGFHGELTGRENIYLSGIILGMKRAEISQCFDAIVSFSGVEKFLDIPVKKYSSGMKLRLAFSIAAHLRSDVLLMDEVLAVGDYEFEKKCLDSVRELGKSGRTILFVSHNLLSIRRLCSRVMVLAHGQQVFIGDPAVAIAHYLGTTVFHKELAIWGKQGLNLSSLVVLYSVKVGGDTSGERGHVYSDAPVKVTINYRRLHEHKNFLIKLLFYDDSDTLLFLGTYALRAEDRLEGRDLKVECEVPRNIFQEGKITIGLQFLNVGQEGVCVDGEEANLFYEKELLCFYVKERIQRVGLENETFWQAEKGKIKPLLEWNISKQDTLR